MKVQLIRNATMRITYKGHCFLTDPYLADPFSLPTYAGKSKNPTAALPLSIEEILAGIDMVLLSHLHSDHFDAMAQSALPKDILILCQPGNEAALQALGFSHVIPITETYTWQGIHFKQVFGRHGSGEVLKLMGTSSGYSFQAQGEPTVYWTGDTILCDPVIDFARRIQPDVTITHSGGALWNQTKIVMDELDTIQYAQLFPKSLVIAVHMEAVDHATITRSALRAYAQHSAIRDQQLRIPSDGETIVLESFHD